MAVLLFLSTLYMLSLPSLPLMEVEAQAIKSARLLDVLLRDYAFKSFSWHLRTGTVHTVNLPANFSGIRVDAARFRCGSLRRYGAQMKEFHLGTGVIVHPCTKRVVLVSQNLGDNWSSIYNATDLSGYQLVSPVLGLLAYNADYSLNLSNNYEVGIFAAGKPITVDFRNITKGSDLHGIRPLCATFEGDGKMTIKHQVSADVCVAIKHGHFGLVIELLPSVPVRRSRINGWKMAVGSSVGAALGAFLLGLLLVAMLVKVKNRAMMEELERRTYEAEALQVSMVGHIGATTANGARTTTIDSE